MSILQRKKGTKQQTLLIFVWCVLNPWILSKSIQIFHQPIKNNSWNIPGKTITSEEVGRKQLKWNKKIIRIRIRYSHKNEKRTKNNPKKICSTELMLFFQCALLFLLSRLKTLTWKSNLHLRPRSLVNRNKHTNVPETWLINIKIWHYDYFNIFSGQMVVNLIVYIWILKQRRRMLTMWITRHGIHKHHISSK